MIVNSLVMVSRPNTKTDLKNNNFEVTDLTDCKIIGILDSNKKLNINMELNTNNTSHVLGLDNKARKIFD